MGPTRRHDLSAVLIAVALFLFAFAKLAQATHVLGEEVLPCVAANP
jgi:hypothetical protein